MKVYLDGKFFEEEEAVIPVSDRGLLMGDGVFVTIQVNEGNPYFLKRHLVKLKDQAKKLGMVIPEIEEETIGALIEENRAYNGVWRLKIYYTGGSDPSMRLPDQRKGHLIMILKPYIVPSFGPLKVSIFPEPIQTLTSSMKSLSHVVRYMIMEEALNQGLDDFITVNSSEELLETAFGNIFWIHENDFFTPDPSLPLHFGITIAVLMEMAPKIGFKPHFVKKKLHEIPKTAHLFRANTMGGIRPILMNEFSRDQNLERKLLTEFNQWIKKESGISSALAH